MELSHLHVSVVDLENAIAWFARMLDVSPDFNNGDMAVIEVGSLSIILDKSESDSEITIAFRSDNCDADFQRFHGRGASVLSPPANQPWGVRTAYLQGPGHMVIEIEQGSCDLDQ